MSTPIGSKSTGSSKGSSGRSSVLSQNSTAGGGGSTGIGVGLVSGVGSSVGVITADSFLAADDSQYEAASLVHYTPVERAALRSSSLLSSDKLDVVRGGPGFVQSGLSSFGPFLAVRRETDAGASVSLAERGSDVWAGISNLGYFALWAGGGGVEGSGSTDATLLDFERFLGEQYTRAVAGCFLYPRLTGNKKGCLVFFVLTEEGHGLTYMVEVGLVLDAAPDGGREPIKRVGIISHRRLILKKAMYARDIPQATTTTSTASNMSKPMNVCFHPVSNCILLTLDTEIYAYHADTLQNAWSCNIGPTILGSNGTNTNDTNAAAHMSGATPNSVSTHLGNGVNESKGVGSHTHASSTIRLDAKQKRTHCITAIGFPALLNQEPACIIAAATGNNNTASLLPTSPKQSFTGMANNPSVPLGADGVVPPVTPAAPTQPLPPFFFIVGTRSGYLVRLDLRRRDGLLGSVKVTPDLKILTRFVEHHFLYTGMNEQEMEKEVTPDQRDELARRKEDERRKKVEAQFNQTGNRTTTTTLTPNNTNSASLPPALAQPTMLRQSSLSSALGSAGVGDSMPAASSPIDPASPNSPTDTNDYNQQQTADAAIDLSDYPNMPLLITSPWFDMAANPPPAEIRSSAYSSSITALQVVLRRNEWIIIVGCADGFVHIVSRDARSHYRIDGMNSSTGVASLGLDSKYARYLTPHPIAFEPTFTSSLLYTLADPPPHGTATKLPSVVKIAASIDGSNIFVLDASGALRRWDLNQRMLSGITQTDGIIETQAALASGGGFGTASGVVDGGGMVPLTPVHLDLIYPAAQSELAILTGPGGILAGLTHQLRTPDLSRATSFSLPQGGAVLPATKTPIIQNQSNTITTAMLLASGLLLPTHILLVSHTSFTLWRAHRLPRLSKHVAPSSSSVLIADLNEFIAAYQLDDRKAADSLGLTQGAKLRKERMAAESREAAFRKRTHALAERGDSGTPLSMVGLPPRTPASAPISPQHRSAITPTAANTATMQHQHHSIAATPNHPGGLELTSATSTRPASPGTETFLHSNTVSQVELITPPTSNTTTVKDFYGFSTSVDDSETGATEHESGVMAGGAASTSGGATNSNISDINSESDEIIEAMKVLAETRDITIRLDRHGEGEDDEIITLPVVSPAPPTTQRDPNIGSRPNSRIKRTNMTNN